jgi:hypothetical protein
MRGWPVAQVMNACGLEDRCGICACSKVVVDPAHAECVRLTSVIPNIKEPQFFTQAMDGLNCRCTDEGLAGGSF